MKKRKPIPSKKNKNSASFSKFHQKKKVDKKAASFDKKEEESTRYKKKTSEKPKLFAPKSKKKDKKPTQKKAAPLPQNLKLSQSTSPDAEQKMRLNKYVAHCGICSRRKASEHIKNGLVKVNNQVILEIGHKVEKEDIVQFENKVITPSRNFVYILLNKPKNVITTLKDERGRRTVAEFIKEKTKERVYPVGRLDRNTTGLLILTNDGNLAQKLSHPSYEVKKVYKATLDKPLEEEDLLKIRDTLQLEDGPAPVDGIEYANKNLKVIGIELHIGRNRIVRRIFQHLGYEVVKLDRVRYSNLTKKNLPLGYSRFLSKEELLMLKHFV